MYRRVVLHNIRVDKEIASFANAAGVGVDTLSLLPEESKRGRSAGKSGACSAISFYTGASSVADIGIRSACWRWLRHPRPDHMSVCTDAHAQAQGDCSCPGFAVGWLAQLAFLLVAR